jgi:hypothetical protein
MSGGNLVFRVPKDLIPVWNRIKEKVAREHPDMIDEDGDLKDSTVLKAMIMDYNRRDFYVISTSLEKIFPILNTIGSKVENLESSLAILKMDMMNVSILETLVDKMANLESTLTTLMDTINK